MAITKASLKTVVAKRTARAEAEITDDLIRAVLLDLTLEIPALRIEAITEIVKGQKNVNLNTFPEKFRTIDVVKINDERPLNRIRSFANYQTLIQDETETDYNEPKYYIVYNDLLYLYPIPDKAYTLAIFASAIELNADDIDLPDIYEECIIEGLCAKLYIAKGLGNSPQAVVHINLYNDLKLKLLALENKRQEADSVKYRDI